MKKNTVAQSLFALFFVVIMAGCASAPVSIADCGPVAVIAVNGNPALPWELDESDDESTDDGNGVLTTMVNKLVDGSNPELTTGKDRLDYALNSLKAGLLDIAGVEVIDTEAVLAAENYQSIRESVFNMLDTKISAAELKTISSIGAKHARMLMSELNAKTLLLLDFEFRKTCIKGNKWNGNIAPMLTMKVHMINSRGKEVVNRTFMLKSSKYVSVSGRKYDKSALVGLYPELIDNAISQFIVSYIQ